MVFTRWKIAGLITGIIAFLCIIFIDSPLHHVSGADSRPALAAAVGAMMAIWWLTEALPIYATACVPLVLFPLLNVFKGSFGNNLIESTLPYLDPYIWLFAGGMCIAAAMQQWDLHRRIALTIMQLIGSDPRRLLFGFLASTAFISMWISNTATATMMVPIGIAVIAQLERYAGKRLQFYGMAIMLAIAYAANVGGIGTKIGTAPNSQFAGFMSGIGIEISFLAFMVVGMPFVIIFIPVVWYFLWCIGRRDVMETLAGAEAIHQEKHLLGKIKKEEWIVLAIFLVTATLWILGKVLTDFFKQFDPGFKITSAHIEGSIAVLAAIVLLLWRSRGKQILTGKSLKTVPWETLLLLGGSFALAAGIQKSGLSGWMGAQLVGIRDLAPFTQVLMASLATVGISAVASNTATIGIMLNVLHHAVTPAYMTTTLFSATISASCDFALPAGTPPNAIVFGSGYVTIPQMAKTGVLLDVLAAILSSVLCWFLVRLVL
jgi:sodium-dependent dicarboxylate transporter 2/3/5